MFRQGRAGCLGRFMQSYFILRFQTFERNPPAGKRGHPLAGLASRLKATCSAFNGRVSPVPNLMGCPGRARLPVSWLRPSRSSHPSGSSGVYRAAPPRRRLQVRSLPTRVKRLFRSSSAYFGQGLQQRHALSRDITEREITHCRGQCRP